MEPVILVDKSVMRISFARHLVSTLLYDFPIIGIRTFDVSLLFIAYEGNRS
jgi:hypothetical protein